MGLPRGQTIFLSLPLESYHLQPLNLRQTSPFLLAFCHRPSDRYVVGKVVFLGDPVAGFHGAGALQ